MVYQSFVFTRQGAGGRITTGVIGTYSHCHSCITTAGKDCTQIRKIFQHTRLPVTGRTNLEGDLTFRQLLQILRFGQRDMNAVTDSIEGGEVAGVHIVDAGLTQVAGSLQSAGPGPGHQFDPFLRLLGIDLRPGQIHTDYRTEIVLRHFENGLIYVLGQASVKTENLFHRDRILGRSQVGGDYLYNQIHLPEAFGRR